jgi:O-antigen ligase
MIDQISSRVAIYSCAVGLLLAWSQDPLVWFGFSGFVFLQLALWCTCRLLLKDRYFSGGRLGAGLFAWACLAAVGAWGTVQLQLGWSAYRLSTEIDILRWLVFAAVAFLVGRLPTDGSGTDWFRSGFAVYAFLLTGFSLLDHLTRNQLFGLAGESSAGPFLNSDHFATFILLAFPFVLAETLKAKTSQAFWVVASSTMVAGMVGSLSRAGIGLFTVEVIVLAYLLMRRRGPERRSRTGGEPFKLLGIVGIVSLLLSLAVGFEAVNGHFEHLTADIPVRLQLSQATVEMFLLRPWTGFGLGSWAHVYPRYALFDIGRYANAAHDDWAQWASEGGIPLIAVMVFQFLASIRLAWRNPWALGLVAVLLHCLVDFPMQGRFLPALVWCVFAIAAKAK